jgi:hypothetical protein
MLCYKDIIRVIPAQTLPIVYFISGCDDCTIKLKNFAWKKALALVSEKSGREAVFAALDEKFAKKDTILMKSEFNQLIHGKIYLI